MTEERFNAIIEEIYCNINSQGTEPANEILEYIKKLESQIKDLRPSNMKTWFSVHDNKNPMPKDRDFLIKFDNGYVIKHSRSNWLFTVVTHWAEL